MSASRAGVEVAWLEGSYGWDWERAGEAGSLSGQKSSLLYTTVL